MIETLGGYAGNSLWVDLTSGKVLSKPLEEAFLKQYVGGHGIAGKILYDMVSPSVKPFDPENLLIFSSHPLTGTLAPGTNRYTVVTKSPLTGFFGDASAGGFWGPELKYTGHDMIVISGKASKPVLLWIDDTTVEIREANSYWGMSTHNADKAIRDDLGDPEIKVACIGPAGENLVKFASIVSDGGYGVAARCGIGAVMGSKNLKAVALRGLKEVAVHDYDALKQLYLEIMHYTRTDEKPKGWSARGTPGDVAALYAVGGLPAYNWTDGEFDDPKVKNLSPNDLNAEKLTLPGGYEAILRRKRSCFGCTLHCRRVVAVGDRLTRGPELETLSLFGVNCGIDDVKVVAELNMLCDDYGMDTISASETIAFAMECYHRGILTKNDVDGLDLDFGNGQAAIEMVHRIAARKDFGNVLAEGSKRAAQTIGKGAEDYAVHVKGLEFPAHDPRRALPVALHYAVGPTGARHSDGLWFCTPEPGLGLQSCDPLSPEGKAFGTKIVEDWCAFYACVGYCWFAHRFPGFGHPEDKKEEYVIKLYSAVTGIQLTLQQALTIGERIFNIKKAFNMKHGATRADDTLPKKILTRKHRVLGNVIGKKQLDKLLVDYYKVRGWDLETSMPTKEKLVELGLEDVATSLWSKNASEQVKN